MDTIQLTTVMLSSEVGSASVPTIQTTTASAEYFFFCLQEKKLHCRSTQSQQRLCGPTMISTLKKLFFHLQQCPIFRLKEAVLQEVNA